MPQLLAAAAAAASAADRACQSPHHSTEDEATQANCTQTSEWVLNKAAVKRQLLDTVEARKQAYCGHTVSKQGSCLEKEIMQRNNARCAQARKTTHGLDGQHQDVDRTLRGN